MLHKISSFFLIIGFILMGNAQSSKYPNDVLGLWSKDDSVGFNKKDWHAQWIWMPDTIANDVMLARRVFNLESSPEVSELRITASSKYELYINGHYISQGPARSAPHHQSYDIYNISPVLNKGKNVIAVRVHHQHGTKSYHLNGRPGLLVQLDGKTKDSTWSIKSDKNWKVFPDESWHNDSPAMNRFQPFVNDQVNMNLKVQKFERISFDDTKWMHACPLYRNTGWPARQKNESATTITAPWTSLIQRDLPYLIEDKIAATSLIEAKVLNASHMERNKYPLDGSIDNQLNADFKYLVNKNKPVQLPPAGKDKSWFLLFDFGKVINALPEFIIEGEKDTELSVMAAPFIINDEFTCDIVDSSFKDQVILSGKTDHWKSMYFKPTRYLALAVHNKAPLKIHSLGLHQLKYPFELKGAIHTPETPWIEELWQASAKTIDVCTTDAFTDNYRERRQYAQTGYYAALGNYFTFGDFTLQRRYLLQIAQEQQADGLMPAYAPLNKSDYMVILDSNIFYIRSLYNYYLYSGDLQTTKILLPPAKKLMTLLNSFTNEFGMIDSPPYSYWLDHTLNDRRGANLTLNGHYLGALEDFSAMLEWIGEIELSDDYKEKADFLRTNLRNNLWDHEKQLFADALIGKKRSDQYSEHGNAMALALKIATEEQAKLIASRLLTEDHHNFIFRTDGMTMVSPAMSYWLHKGLADWGYQEASLKMLYNRFRKMMGPDTNGTLWEEWWRNGTGRTGKLQLRTRSDAQTESVFPPALFTEYVLGLKVSQPGFKEVIISKPEIPFSKVSGSIPSPKGNIEIKWTQQNKKSKLHLIIPKGVNAFIKNKELQVTMNKPVRETSDHSGNPTTWEKAILLPGGEYEIIFD